MPCVDRCAPHLVRFANVVGSQSKSLVELLRAYAVLKVCTIPIVVKYGGDLLQTARDRLGDTLVLPIVKVRHIALNFKKRRLTQRYSLQHTFFAHFCAGKCQLN